MTDALLFGPYGGQALAQGERLPLFGVNAVWFHGFDERAFEACDRAGLAACVEFKTFRADLRARPELIPIGADGKPIRFGRLVQGVCLSQNHYLDEIEQNLREGVARLGPHGVWLDYLTYAGWFETPDPDLQESCFCAGCVAEFCEATGIDADAPEEILSRHKLAWTEHKCRRIAGFAARYAEIIRGARPDCIVGAYMCPWTPQEFDGALTRIFAQDYELLAPSIDVFTPLIYAKKSGRKPDWGCQFLRAARGFIPPHRKVQLILDVLDFPDALRTVGECPVPSWGIQLFGGADVFADDARAAEFRRGVEAIRPSV